MVYFTIVLLLGVTLLTISFFHKKEKKKRAQEELKRLDAEQLEKKLSASRAEAILKKINANPGSFVTIEDPADIAALIDHQQALLQASDEMDKRATVPADYSMMH